MKKFIAYLPLTALFIIGITLSFAQQNQNTQKPNPEIETLKNRISELESKLQTVENVEKMELAAKLADAQAKLRSAEFGKFERELRDTNDEWLRTWSTWFITIIAIVVTILCAIGAGAWSRFKSKTDQLIEDEVEKSLDGFKEAVAQLNEIKNQLKVLQKEHAASILENFMWFRFSDENPYPEQINALPESALLDVFGDNMYYLHLRRKAAEVLTNKGSARLISPMLEFLNSAVDSDLYNDTNLKTKSTLRSLASFLSVIHTQETYDGLKKFLNRLLTENLKHKDLFLTWTVFSLAYISIELNRTDSVSIIRQTLPDLRVLSQDEHGLKNLVEYFDTFDAPEGIKEIVTNGIADRMPDVETRCLELLQKHDSEFVKEWQAQKESTNTQNEES